MIKLLAAGADVHALDKFGHSPLMHLARRMLIWLYLQGISKWSEGERHATTALSKWFGLLVDAGVDARGYLMMEQNIGAMCMIPMLREHGDK